MTLELGTHLLTLEEAADVVLGKRSITICSEAIERARRAAEFLHTQAEAGRVIYGVTTGFGANAETVIDDKHTRILQANLIKSHACGVGAPLPESIVRAMLLFRLNALLTEHSGARPETLHALAALLNRQVHPVVPEQGSVGASGDLCPLAHLCLPLLGLGKAEHQGEIVDGERALEIAGLTPLQLSYKEGIALLNGTQAQSALAFVILQRLNRALQLADAACAMSLEALCGRSSAFDERLHALRRHSGQIASAARIRRWVEGSELVDADPDTIIGKVNRVQDPYSLRCAPQVHGACIGVMEHVSALLANEINAVTDNPILFPEEGDILSGGNFHGEPVAMALDYLNLAIAEIANISDRRSYKLLTPSENEGLPAFLVDQPGVNSGLMIAQYVTAALVSDNKVLAHPSSVDSIPTSANKEDIVAMGAQAGVQAMRMLNNTERVLAIELIIAAQALDMRIETTGLSPAPLTAELHTRIRKLVPYLDQDRVLSDEIEALSKALTKADGLLPEAAEEIG